MNGLQEFANKNHLAASHFTAIGAFSRATIGFFYFSIKDYKRIEIEEQAEVLNITGDISLFQNDKRLRE